MEPEPAKAKRRGQGGRDLLVVSDAHLGGWSDGGGGREREELVENDLVDMLEHAVQVGLEPVFAGDMFDYWMEYGSRVPEPGPRFRAVLTRLARRNGSVDMVTGNHDNWTGGYFPERGVNVHEETVIRESEAGRILILHGDGLRDASYGLPRPRMHRLLRNAWFVAFYRALLPPGIGWGLMRWFSARSRRHQADDPGRLDKASHGWVAAGRARIVVAGHDHRARLLIWENGIYANCGCFGRDRTACIVRKDAVQVVRWDAGRSGFVTLDEAKLPSDGSAVEPG